MFSRILAAISILILIGCAQTRDNPVGVVGGTGHLDRQGRPFITNDPRLPKAIDEEVPKETVNPTPQEKQKINFLKSFDQFQLLRFDDGKKAQYQGKKRFEFQIHQTFEKGSGIVIKFEGFFQQAGSAKGGKKISFEPIKGNEPHSDYTLEGEITDAEDVAAGTFTIRQGDESAKIRYSAYVSNDRKIHRDRNDDLTKYQALDNAIKDLEKNLYAWVVKYWIPGGASTEHVDVLQVIQKGGANDLIPKPRFSFTSDSVIGTDESIPAKINKSAKDSDIIVESVQREGLSQKKDLDVFSWKLKDPKSNKTTEIWVDLKRSGTTSADLIPDSEKEKPPKKPDTDDDDDDEPPPTKATPPPPPPPPQQKREGSTGSTTQQITLPKAPAVVLPPERPTQQITPKQNQSTPPPASQSNATPPPAKGPAPQVERPATPAGYKGINSSSFWIPDLRYPRIRRMVDAFDSNWEVPVVQKWYNKWKKLKPEKRDDARLVRVFRWVKPYVEMSDAISRAFESWGFLFLVPTESQYFQDGRYFSEIGDGGLAVGPFQIHPDTATDMKMSREERNFFAPSACGAAKYLRDIVDNLGEDRDATLAFLGYNRGPKVAQRIARFNRFGYTFAEVSESNLANKDGVTYTGRVLATYFIFGNYRALGFSDDNAPDQMDARTTFPKTKIKNPQCEAAVSSFR